MNQALFEKIYVSSSNDTPLKVEARFNPPFDMIIEPFKEELREVNQAAKLKIGDVAEKIKATKNRILDELRCGPSETYSDSKNFRYKSWSTHMITGSIASPVDEDNIAWCRDMGDLETDLSCR